MTQEKLLQRSFSSSTWTFTLITDAFSHSLPHAKLVHDSFMHSHAQTDTQHQNVMFFTLRQTTESLLSSSSWSINILFSSSTTGGRCNISGGQHQLLPNQTLFCCRPGTKSLRHPATASLLLLSRTSCMRSEFRGTQPTIEPNLHHHHSCHHTTMFGPVQFYCLQLFPIQFNASRISALNQWPVCCVVSAIFIEPR